MSYSPKIDALAHDPLQTSGHHPRFQVRPADLALIANKITVGVVITAIPLVVFGGGLTLTRALLHSHRSAVTPRAKTTNLSPRS